MFEFFKEKIKSWIGKSKEEIKEKAEKKEKKLKKEKAEETKEKPRKEEEKAVIIEPVKRTAPTPEEIEKERKPGIFRKIKQVFTYGLTESDFDDLFEKLEILLLENNVALEAVDEIKKQLKSELLDKEIKKENLEKEIKNSLKKVIDNLLIEPDDLLALVKEKQPFILIFTL